MDMALLRTDARRTSDCREAHRRGAVRAPSCAGHPAAVSFGYESRHERKADLVLGGGFAGLWSAVGAARKLDELGRGPEAAEVTLVNRDGYHNIRVRNYEADLSAVRVPLDDVLGPVGVRRVEGDVAGIDLAEQAVTVTTA